MGRLKRGASLKRLRAFARATPGGLFQATQMDVARLQTVSTARPSVPGARRT